MKENKQVAALCPEEIDETFDENHYVKITDENVKILSEHRLKNNDVDSRAIRALTHKDLSFDDMTNLMRYRDAKETENDYRFQVAVTEDEMIYVNKKRYFYKHSCYDGMQDFEIYDYVNVTAEENKLIDRIRYFNNVNVWIIVKREQKVMSTL